ncbi:2-hydroxychromene-2-carboxylate isomerase [Conexibacter sp. CPCC 206217]|uniref:2-hydroxychromene-2-carboxylate isomerase n=1 Tax=Conexibacter sp. CPCC 206217 TaxID=3064574 RepID=UPI002722AD25|nr:DsbA family protein [Conexibacter sp. CPCC 206217]MDO8211214.1 DsbA family protein [Conexibacter sp. CPCC 206217]
MPPEPPVFYYDVSSPYAYLAAHRVDALLPVAPRWVPIAFGALLLEIGKVPWSWQEGTVREGHMRECERRAAARGLPLVWPSGFPRATYSIPALRAVLVADEHGRQREMALALFDAGLGRGLNLRELDVLLDAADAVGVPRDAVAEGVRRPEIKARLRANTDAARERGVTGAPTIAVGDRLFWGDDRLEAAAKALATA